MNRVNVSSGTPWENSVGYSRAVRVGDLVYVSGTTASEEDGTTAAVGDAFAQARFILKKIETALQEAGAELSDVVRTRMFVTDISRWREIGLAHAEVFGSIRPAATMVEVQRLVNPDHLVEIEAEAVVAGNLRSGLIPSSPRIQEEFTGD
jgi:enamine deaminase RidA (YjgF/YER057c/UK114 family)